MNHFWLDPSHTDPKRLAREREAGRALKRTQWWQERIKTGVCHYCGQVVGRAALTMDHIVPLARGGRTAKGNVVPSCRPCNQSKKLQTPVDEILDRS